MVGEFGVQGRDECSVGLAAVPRSTTTGHHQPTTTNQHCIMHQVVNGPEVLSKYVGQAEENIRNLFGEAEAEYKEKGDASVSRQG